MAELGHAETAKHFSFELMHTSFEDWIQLQSFVEPLFVLAKDGYSVFLSLKANRVSVVTVHAFACTTDVNVVLGFPEIDNGCSIHFFSIDEYVN